MTHSVFTDTEVAAFVRSLWRHVELRSLEAPAENLLLGGRELHKLLDGVNVQEHYVRIGEALAAYILDRIITLARSYEGGRNSVAASQHGQRFGDKQISYQHKKAVLLQAICRLDGAFGIESNKLASIAEHYLSLMGDKENDINAPGLIPGESARRPTPLMSVLLAETS